MSSSTKGVHFGAGNIGRGFVAEFLHNSGFEVVFVDVMDAVIDSLQKTKSYTVTEVSDEGEHDFTIDNYRALNSKTDMESVIQEIATADTVTCAVGPNILKFIAEPIAKGIAARKAEKPIAVIACENAIGATDTLRRFIEEKMDSETKDKIGELARFANSAVDRIIPIQPDNAGLNVRIEKFYEWCVEKSPFLPMEPPAIKGVHYVEDLKPYIERKLYTVNTGHATAAYYGYQYGVKYIHDTLANQDLKIKVVEVLMETSDLICTIHPHVSREEQAEYMKKIISRFSNPALRDNIERVGRAPLRKLGRRDRLIGPAAQLADLGQSCKALLGAIEMALRFTNVPGDDESVQLSKILKSDDATTATKKITGLEESHPVFNGVSDKVKKVQNEIA
ncbi:hypothetical protein K470DRAFT_271648 [Piedraia hortae CBS 480.64]|uniref:Mannitol-1-phosphate 5-dehydrogenase n=1 Tax=Piedraia hortae CBS 480.64 TaxID=1314780 RepID=A0A6A7BWI1_9PEZI|nr:hypothetical protein K470DRAFT_271648 [Piedraia hortae CBS 480.64]